MHSTARIAPNALIGSARDRRLEYTEFDKAARGVYIPGVSSLFPAKE
jgi:hypothetical protein